MEEIRLDEPPQRGMWFDVPFRGWGGSEPRGHLVNRRHVFTHVSLTLAPAGTDVIFSMSTVHDDVRRCLMQVSSSFLPGSEGVHLTTPILIAPKTKIECQVKSLHDDPVPMWRVRFREAPTTRTCARCGTLPDGADLVMEYVRNRLDVVCQGGCKQAIIEA